MQSTRRIHTLSFAETKVAADLFAVTSTSIASEERSRFLPPHGQ